MIWINSVVREGINMSIIIFLHKNLLLLCEAKSKAFSVDIWDDLKSKLNIK